MTSPLQFWHSLAFTEPEHLLEVAKTAEAVGFHGVLVSDHLFFPGRLSSRYPYSDDGKPGFDGATPFPDPWALISAMAAVTARLRFATMVYILPLRHPLEVAKTVGTAALLSGGRVMLGCGAGWIREEYDALGVDFATRGRRYDEMIEVMRKAWTGASFEHRGRCFELGPLQMSPPPPAQVPVYVGGLSPAALRRAARLGDGWIGTGQSPEEAVEYVARLRRLREDAGRAGEPFETIVPLTVPPDRELLTRLEAAGVTSTTLWPFTYTLGPTSPLSAKRTQMFRMGTDLRV
jgi:probable F420-dependent oxidoreductase